MVPDVLVDTKHLNPGQPGRVVGQLGEQRAIASQTVCQSTPSRRASGATEALSRWMQLIAHHAARAVSLARGRASEESSPNTPTGQADSTQR